VYRSREPLIYSASDTATHQDAKAVLQPGDEALKAKVTASKTSVKAAAKKARASKKEGKGLSAHAWGTSQMKPISSYVGLDVHKSTT
jgi:hypothetical protein